MRLLFDMQYYQGTNISGTSLYHALMDFVAAMPKGEHFVYVMLPAKNALGVDWKYDETKEFDMTKVRILEAVPYQATRRVPSGVSAGGYSDEELHWLTVAKLPWYYDAVIVCRQFAVHTAKVATMRSQKGTYRPAIMAWAHDPITEKKKKDGYWDEYAAKAELFQMSLADGVLFYMQADKDDVVFKSGTRWLSPSERLALAKEPVMGNPLCFDAVDALKEKYPRDKKEGPLTVGYFNSFWVKKRPKEASKLMDTLHRLRGANGIVTSIATDDEGLFQQPFVEKHLGMGRHDYLPYLFKADIVFVLSMHETGGRSYWESLASGSVLVFLMEDWLKPIVPDWYPYKCDSLADLEKLALVVADDMEKAREWSNRLDKHIRKFFDHKEVTNRLLEHTAKVVAEKCPAVPKNSLYRLVKTIVETEKLDMFTLDDLNKHSDKYTKDKRKLMPSQFNSRQYISKILLDLGYADTYEYEYPVFYKKEEE